jgi:hypothetical protein
VLRKSKQFLTSDTCCVTGTCRVTQVANSVIGNEWGQNRILVPTNRMNPWLFVTQIFVMVNQVGFDPTEVRTRDILHSRHAR